MPRHSLVLASTSHYRRTLLERLGVPFTVAAPDTDERRLPGEPPHVQARRLAEQKARSVAARHPGALVIGADQVAVIDTEPLGKPGTAAATVEQLLRASGRRVMFETGLCLLEVASGRVQLDVVPFAVVFRHLDRAEVEEYVRRERPYDCAGGFRVEGLGIALFERLEGTDPTALVGLPLIRLAGMLRAEGLNVLTQSAEA
jgi:septum formation protein